MDGKKLAEVVRGEVALRVKAFEQSYGRVPGLDVVIVGEDPASQVYVRSKEKAALEVGIRGRVHALPAATTESELLVLLASLNADPVIDGILVQLPLPGHIREIPVLDALLPEKDVDGFHPANAGLLATARPGLVPCTPRGCMRLLASLGVSLSGMRAVVVGRSNIVGKPLAGLLLAQNATVTVAHSRTRDLPSVCREADVLVAAVGKPELIRGDWIKEGAIVIDVGINRVAVPGSDPPGRTRLVGDVCFAEVRERASAITPVPGGVGPMTIACLLENTCIAAEAREARRRR